MCYHHYFTFQIEF